MAPLSAGRLAEEHPRGTHPQLPTPRGRLAGEQLREVRPTLLLYTRQLRPGSHDTKGSVPSWVKSCVSIHQDPPTDYSTERWAIPSSTPPSEKGRQTGLILQSTRGSGTASCVVRAQSSMGSARCPVPPGPQEPDHRDLLCTRPCISRVSFRETRKQAQGSQATCSRSPTQ